MKRIKSISILFIAAFALLTMALPAMANDEAADKAATKADTEAPPVDSGPTDDSGQDAEGATPSK